MNIKDYGSAKHLCTTCTSIRPCGTLGRTSFIDSFIHQVILERFLLYAPALTIRKGLRKTNHYSRQEAMWNLFSSPGVPTKTVLISIMMRSKVVISRGLYSCYERDHSSTGFPPGRGTDHLSHYYSFHGRHD